MFDFLISKEKLQTNSIRQVPIEEFEIIGIGQINPYCKNSYDNEMFLTLVNFAGDCSRYDEKEGLVLSDYFILKKCPSCHKTQLIPVKIYLKYYQNKKTNLVFAYCNSCSASFEAYVKSSDVWIKQARKIKTKDLVNKSWVEYTLD